MRVLYFSTGFGPHDQRFLSALARTRHEVHFLRLRRRDASTEEPGIPARIHEVEWAGIRGPLRWWEIPRLASAFRRVTSEIMPDLVHAGPIQSCALVAVLSGFRPVLTMSWGFDLMQDAERSWLWRWATRYTLQKSAFFVSDAGVTRDRAVAYGMSRDRTAVFPWGVDLRRFHPGGGRSQPSRTSGLAGRPGSRSARPSRTRSFAILCNRSWESRYGVDVLARAFVLAAPGLRGAALILLGAGSEGRSIRAILQAGGQLARVRFGGRVQQAEIHRWYRQADLYVSPSHIDGSSVSLMEAMASGMPVLISDIPANREWVSDGVNGWLFRDGDVGHLAERISWIAGQEAARARMGRAARKTAEARADWSRNFKVLLWAYQQAASSSVRQ